MAAPGSIDAFVEEELNAFFSTNSTQTKKYRAYARVIVDGKDVTDRLDPYLISIQIRNGGGWTADVELDDRDARLAIPRLGADLEIDLGWASDSVYRAFTGRINEVEHGFGRRLGGRRMFLHASSLYQTSMVKTPFQDHMGEGATPGKAQGEQVRFVDAANQFFGNAGLTPDIGQSLMGITNDYWSMNNESVMQWGQRHADDFGALFRIEGTTAVIKRPKDFNASNLVAKWGDNLISWKVHPYAARPLWGSADQQFFDHVEGLWKHLSTQFNLPAPWGGAQAVSKLPMPAPNSNIAQQQNDGASHKGQLMPGFGRIIINGEPQAIHGSRVQMIGARPGVDGWYFVDTAVHTYSRQGFVTTLEVHPDTQAGTDNIGDQGYEQSGGPAGEAAAP